MPKKTYWIPMVRLLKDSLTACPMSLRSLVFFKNNEKIIAHQRTIQASLIRNEFLEPSG